MSFTLRYCRDCGFIGDLSPDELCSSCLHRHLEYPETSEGISSSYSSVPQLKEVKPVQPGKPSISLIPREAILEMAKAFDYGTGKHGRYAFREGVEFTKLIDAAMRHLLAITEGEDVDEESKTLHAACAMSNLAMLIFCMKNRPEFDDRWKHGKET